MRFSKSSKVVCCCAYGQVRSVAARRAVYKLTDCRSVLACGLERNDTTTLQMLFEWADVIVVAGEAELAARVPAEYVSKLLHINIGKDIWGDPFAVDLAHQVTRLLANYADRGILTA